VTLVHVGIVSWNTADDLGRCLGSLPAALEGTEYTVAVVDNASSDGSVDVATSHAGVDVVRNERNVGYARAMNQALASAPAAADVLVALNPDTVPPAGSLAELIRRLVTDSDVGLVVPRLLNQDGRLQHSVYRFPSVAVATTVAMVPQRALAGGRGRDFWLEGWAPHDTPTDIDWAIGAVHVLRAAAVDRTQVYNERWFMYVEDLDLCWQLASSGWRRRLEADVTVTHVGNAAGAQAWGATRLARWQWATYDWFALRNGRTARRAYAAVNALGVLVLLAGQAFTRLLRRPGRRGVVARDLLDALPIHLEAIVARDLGGRAQGGAPGTIDRRGRRRPAGDRRRRSDLR
jgi:GT2 family glycosyltransferase